MTSISITEPSNRYVLPEPDHSVRDVILQHLISRYHSPQYHWTDVSPSLLTAGRSVRSILQEFPNVEKPIAAAFRSAKRWATEACRFSLALSVSAPIFIPTTEWMHGKLSSPFSDMPQYFALSLGLAAVAIPAATLFGFCRGYYTQRRDIQSGLLEAKVVHERIMLMRALNRVDTKHAL